MCSQKHITCVLPLCYQNATQGRSLCFPSGCNSTSAIAFLLLRCSLKYKAEIVWPPWPSCHVDVCVHVQTWQLWQTLQYSWFTGGPITEVDKVLHLMSHKEICMLSASCETLPLLKSWPCQAFISATHICIFQVANMNSRNGTSSFMGFFLVCFRFLCASCCCLYATC